MKRICYATIAILVMAMLVAGCDKTSAVEVSAGESTKDIDITAAFTDPVFRDYVSDNFCGGREAIMISDVMHVTMVIDVSDMGVYSLAGIEYFTAITTISCANNRIESLDVSANKVLTSLVCSENDMKSLIISNGGALEHLDCSVNELESLDLSGCNALWYLDCSNNKMKSPDVSACTVIEHLKCGSYNNPGSKDS